MTRRRIAVGVNVVAAAVLLASTAAHAVVVGSAYFVPEAESQNAVIGFAHGAPNATFSVPSPTNPACAVGSTFCFTSATGYTLAQFLASGGAFNISGSASDLATNLDTGSLG